MGNTLDSATSEIVMKDEVNSAFAEQGVGPVSMEQLRAASSVLQSVSYDNLMAQMPQDKNSILELRRLGIITLAKQKGYSGICHAMTEEMKVERNGSATSSHAKKTSNIIAADYHLLEKLADLLTEVPGDASKDVLASQADKEMQDVMALMNFAMDTIRDRQIMERKKLLGSSYNDVDPGSCTDTSSGTDTDGSEDLDEEGNILGVYRNNSDGEKSFRLGIDTENKYVIPDESIFPDRGSLRGCYMSLRAGCEFLSQIGKLPGSNHSVTRSKNPRRLAIYNSSAVLHVARLLKQHCRDNELMFWGLNALYFCLRDGCSVDQRNVNKLLSAGDGLRLVRKLNRCCR